MNRSTVRRTKVHGDNWNKDDDDSHDFQQNYGYLKLPRRICKAAIPDKKQHNSKYLCKKLNFLYYVLRTITQQKLQI